MVYADALNLNDGLLDIAVELAEDFTSHAHQPAPQRSHWMSRWYSRLSEKLFNVYSEKRSMCVCVCVSGLLLSIAPFLR